MTGSLSTARSARSPRRARASACEHSESQMFYLYVLRYAETVGTGVAVRVGWAVMVAGTRPNPQVPEYNRDTRVNRAARRMTPRGGGGGAWA
eukprot:3546070-Prymnesium_polylepis.1